MESQPQRVRIPPRLFFLLLIYLPLALLYSVSIPIFEAPGEIQHFFSARRMAQTLSLPTPDNASGLWGDGISPPPLYHVLVAATTFWIDTDEAEERVWLNPAANIGQPDVQGNKNRVVHTEAERFPWRGTVLAVHVGRGVSILFGALAVIATYILILTVSDRRGIATLGTAIFAFNPMFLFLSGTIRQETAIIAFSTLALLLLLQTLQEEPSRRRLMLLGIILGCAILTGPKGLLLLPLVAVMLAAVARHRQEVRWLPAAVLYTLIPMLIVAGWWILYNVLLFQDPTGGLYSSLSSQVSASSSPAAISLWPQLMKAWNAAWGLFGYSNITTNPRIYQIISIGALIAAVGLLKVYSRRRQSAWKQQSAAPVTILLLWVAVTLVAFGLRVQFQGKGGWLLLIASPSIATLIAIGWGQLSPASMFRLWLAIPAVWFLVLGILSPVLTIAPSYQRPPRLSEQQIPRTARRPVVIHGDSIRVLGAEVSPRTLSPGEGLQITLYLQTMEPVTYDAMLFIHLLGREGEVVGQLDSYNGWGTYPTNLWQPGEVIRDTYWVPIAPDARAPTLIGVDVGFYQRGSALGMAPTDESGRPASGIVGSARLLPTSYIEPGVEESLRFELGEQMAINGFTLSRRRARPGETIQLTISWEARRPIVEDWTAFTHLETAGGDIMAQHDKPPLDGDWPTSAWEPGLVITDTYSLVIPPDAPTGEYRLVTGLYLPATSQRMRVSGPPGRVMDGAAILATVKVQP